MPPTGSFPHESFSAALPSTKSSACQSSDLHICFRDSFPFLKYVI
uniref:Uncharacterized protein n=1 Tax=Anguilla anguilla TaxID=7936 RepID=A0A0E9Q3P9_ANGAN